MNLLLIAAVVCFVFEAFGISLGSFSPKWWALGIAFYLAAGLDFAAGLA